MDLIKLLLWFVKVVLHISHHLPNKTKLKFDQDFKAFEASVLNWRCWRMSQSAQWLDSVVPLVMHITRTSINLILIEHHEKYASTITRSFPNMRKSCPPGIPLVGGGWVCELELVIAANWRCAISFLSRFWSSIDIDPLTIFVKPLLVGGTESSFWGVGWDFKVLIFFLLFSQICSKRGTYSSHKFVKTSPWVFWEGLHWDLWTRTLPLTASQAEKAFLL